jgi:hypothetical protein
VLIDVLKSYKTAGIQLFSHTHYDAYKCQVVFFHRKFSQLNPKFLIPIFFETEIILMVSFSPEKNQILGTFRTRNARDRIIGLGVAAPPRGILAFKVTGNFLLIYICNFHVLYHLLLIYICKLHWNFEQASRGAPFIFLVTNLQRRDTRVD